jgi:hypothetical protein
MQGTKQNREKGGSVAVQKTILRHIDWNPSPVNKHTYIQTTVHRYCTVYYIRIPTQCPKSKFY